MRPPLPAARLAFGAAVLLLLVAEWYLLFVKRSGETAYLPAPSISAASLEVAGDATLSQTFVSHADGLSALTVFPRPATGGEPPAGAAELTLRAGDARTLVTRTRLPASDMAGREEWTWTLPRIDRSAGERFELEIALPDAPPGRGLRFVIGEPRYVAGDLTIGGRQQWGDLKFRTRAERARTVDTLRATQRAAGGLVGSEAALVLGLLLLNAAAVTVAGYLVLGGRGEGVARPEAPRPPGRAAASWRPDSSH